ncbi:MAG: hypothetical protein IIT61_05905, partial [Bacteroidales bacterium]|nr:hypothetical protein [Bacteroidales bacterium]
MKKIFSIIAIALIGAFVLSSCNKEYETEPLKTITISGTVKANLDLIAANPGDAPNGTKIIFRIDAEDLCHPTTTDPAYSYSTLQYEAAISGGKYSVELPAVNFKAVSVDIVPVDFKANQIQDATGAVKEKVFSAPSYSITIQEGEVYFEDITFIG